MNIRENKGITMIPLVITIIITIIIAGISINGAVRGIKETQNSSDFSELGIIQHAIFE